MHEVDVLILGAGTAGLNARRAAEKEGASALILDPGPLGTTCARVGCMPSKLLIAAADAAHEARHAGVFGVDADVSVDGARVFERVRRERDRFAGFVVDASEELEAAGKLWKTRGTFTGPHTAETGDGRAIRFKTAVVATGSAPWVPPPFRGLSQRTMLFNDHVFELTEVPESVLVVGTGVIGLELGQALSRLGSRVTLVGLGNAVGPIDDEAIRKVARASFKKELDVHFDYTLESIEEQAEGGVSVDFVGDDGARRAASYRYVLMAAGRRPVLRQLGLEHTGVELDARGVPTIDPFTAQAGHSHVFFAGDVTGDRPLLHEAADEGRIAGANAGRYPNVLGVPRRTPIGVVFSHPQIATVGTPPSQLPAGSYAIGQIDYSRQGRSRVMNLNQGLVRVYAERLRGRLVGAQMFGPRMEHMAHLLAWAVQQGLTVHQVLEMPFYHPVVEEGLRTALRDLAYNLRFSASACRSCEEDGPGA